MRPEPDAWVGRLGTREVRSRSRSGCLTALRRLAGDVPLTVEVTPELVGVSEAARILGWDRRRVATYVSRGAFPEPVAVLASGRVWRREDIEAFGADRARRRGRRIRR
jgi:predicted DNA-binding transcriptional regulator AlpA